MSRHDMSRHAQHELLDRHRLVVETSLDKADACGAVALHGVGEWSAFD